MTDYEKLKAFAEELCPNRKAGNLQYFGGEPLAWFYSCDYVGVYCEFGELLIKTNNRISGLGDINAVVDIDQWIKDTREYWREKGLPSLQNQYCKNNDCLRIHKLNTECEYRLPKDELTAEDLPTGTALRLSRLIEVPEGYTDPIEVSSPGERFGIGCKLTSENIRAALDHVKSNSDNWYDHYPKFGVGIMESAFASHKKGVNVLMAEDYKNNKQSIMTKITNTIKQMALTEPEKTYVKAGLMNVNKEWGCEACETAEEMMLEQFMETKAFKDQMTAVAKEMLENE